MACLQYYDVFTSLPACAPVARCCYVSRGPNCSLRGTDKQIEQSPFLLALVTCRTIVSSVYNVLSHLTAYALCFRSKSLYFFENIFEHKC